MIMVKLYLILCGEVNLIKLMHMCYVELTAFDNYC